MNSSADAYGRIAPLYARLIDPINAATHAVGRKLQAPRPGMTVLDVGCGTGAQLEGYAQAGCAVAGVDISPAMLAHARDRLGDDADLRAADATALPYPDEAFDLVLASMVLHEMPEGTRTAVLREMARVAKTDGRIMVTEFTAGPSGLKGRLLRAVSWVVERAAGADHFRQFRAFVSSGGLPAIASGAAMAIDSTRDLAGANIAIYLGRPIAGS